MATSWYCSRRERTSCKRGSRRLTVADRHRPMIRFDGKILTLFVCPHVYLPTEEMMTRTLRIACAVMWLCAAAAPQAAEPPKTAPATHVTSEQIQEFIAKLPPGRTPHLW